MDEMLLGTWAILKPYVFLARLARPLLPIEHTSSDLENGLEHLNGRKIYSVKILAWEIWLFKLDFDQWKFLLDFYLCKLCKMSWHFLDFQSKVLPFKTFAKVSTIHWKCMDFWLWKLKFILLRMTSRYWKRQVEVISFKLIYKLQLIERL